MNTGLIHFLTIAMLSVSGVVHAFAFVGQPNNPGDNPLPVQVPNTPPVLWPDSKVVVPFTLNFDSEYTAVAVDAMQESWNAVGTRFQLQQGFTPAQSCRGNDGVNVATFRQFLCDGSGFGSVLALTMSSYNYNTATRRWEIANTDIIIDQNRNWVSRLDGPVPQGIDDFHRILLHELGHAAGLDHPDDAGQRVTAIMNSTASDTDSLQDDDIQGLAYLYGGASSTSFQNDGGGGGGGCLVILPFLAWLRWQVRWLSRAVRVLARTTRGPLKGV